MPAKVHQFPPFLSVGPRSIRIRNRPHAPGPWKLEPHDRARDTWMVRTSEGLVIGPISGKANATLVALAPEFHAIITQITDWTYPTSYRSAKALLNKVRKAER